MSEESDIENNEGSVKVFIVNKSQAGMRIDQFLMKVVKGHSRAFLQKCIMHGHILVNDNNVRKSAKLNEDDRITVQWPEEEKPFELNAEKVDFEVVFEDDNLLIINKPPGLVVHPAQGNTTGTLCHGLLDYDPENFGEMAKGSDRPGIVHRLDKDTSGVMCVAKNNEAFEYMKASFKDRNVEKTYLAIVLGEFGTVTGRMENMIGRHPVSRMKMAVVHDGGKPAITNYRVLASTGKASLMQVKIETGRTHQIRVHFSSVNHPILGDNLYGGKFKDAPVHPDRQMLHAWKLVVPSPDTGIMREYMANPPLDFQETLAELGLPQIGIHND